MLLIILTIPQIGSHQRMPITLIFRSKLANENVHRNVAPRIIWSRFEPVRLGRMSTQTIWNNLIIQRDKRIATEHLADNSISNERISSTFTKFFDAEFGFAPLCKGFSDRAFRDKPAIKHKPLGSLALFIELCHLVASCTDPSPISQSYRLTKS
jgi:hypothetical protein